MYFLFAIPAIALLVVLAAEFHSLTKAFRRSPKKVEPAMDALSLYILDSDRSH
jgi:hypothetical protein